MKNIYQDTYWKRLITKYIIEGKNIKTTFNYSEFTEVNKIINEEYRIMTHEK